MAEGRIFKCSTCGKSIEAWSDGNPYYIDEFGSKQYAYHPDHDGLAQCIGNDCPYLCLACGEEFMVVSKKPIDQCPVCQSKDISATFALDGKKCPYCQSGDFSVDPNTYMIS